MTKGLGESLVPQRREESDNTHPTVLACYLGPESKAGCCRYLSKHQASCPHSLTGNRPKRPGSHPVGHSVFIAHPVHSQPSACVCTFFLLGYFHVTLQTIINFVPSSQLGKTGDFRKAHQASGGRGCLLLYAKSLPQTVTFCYPLDVHFHALRFRAGGRRRGTFSPCALTPTG